MCNSESLFQGHAIWHTLSASSSGFVYFYLRGENPISHESGSETSDSDLSQGELEDLESQFWPSSLTTEDSTASSKREDQIKEQI